MDRSTHRHPIPAVGALVFDGARVLLIQRGKPPRKGQWAVPGGQVAWGESLAEAVARETLEETGIRVTAGEMIHWFETCSDADDDGVPRFHYLILAFLAHPETPNQLPVSGDDALDARWVSPVELSALDIVPPSRMLIEKFRP